MLLIPDHFFQLHVIGLNEHRLLFCNCLSYRCLIESILDTLPAILHQLCQSSCLLILAVCLSPCFLCLVYVLLGHTYLVLASLVQPIVPILLILLPLKLLKPCLFVLVPLGITQMLAIWLIGFE